MNTNPKRYARSLLSLALVPAMIVTVASETALAAPAATQATAAVQIPYAQPKAEDAPRLLPLQGTVNARTFAGLRGHKGPIPADAFVRSADLGKLTAADRDALAQAGVKLDIDLRTAEEEAQSHDPLADDPRFGYRRISLMGEEKLDLSKLPPSLGEMYAQALDSSQPQFKAVFEAMAAQADGAILFHCTAGKDRTGMIAALLLDLAGVPRADIVHNYAVSGHYFAPMAKAVMQRPEYAARKADPKMVALMGTPPDAIETFLDKLHRQYGGSASYLKSIGLSDAEIHRLEVRLGQAS